MNISVKKILGVLLLAGLASGVIYGYYDMVRDSGWILGLVVPIVLVLALCGLFFLIAWCFSD